MTGRPDFQIGGLVFQSKAAAARHFGAMLRRYQPHQNVSAGDGVELGWLIERHPHAQQKVGCGIARFMVMPTVYKAVGFWIVRTDGSRTDFSYRACIEQELAPAKRALLAAMRREVEDHIIAFKRRWFTDHGDINGKVRCPLTGVLMTFADAHAEHALPRTFATIAASYLEAKGIDVESLGVRRLVREEVDGECIPQLVDRAMADEWRGFHAKLAVIQVVAKADNRQPARSSKVINAPKQLTLKW